jgi:hypothetical protein
MCIKDKTVISKSVRILHPKNNFGLSAEGYGLSATQVIVTNSAQLLKSIYAKKTKNQANLVLLWMLASKVILQKSSIKGLII